MDKISMDKYGRQTIVPAGSDRVNVVPFKNYKREGDSETLREIERYWQQLRGSFLLPQSGNLKAEDLKPYLSNIFIADKIAPGLVQIKTAGTGISARLGMDPRGMPRRVIPSSGARAIGQRRTCNLGYARGHQINTACGHQPTNASDCS